MAAGFDPRRHSTVALSIKEKQKYFGSASPQDTAMKSYMVGPNKPDAPGIDSLRRPTTSPAVMGRVSQIAGVKNTNSDAHPQFLSPTGKWVQGQLPTLIAESQAQPLSATGTLLATLPGRYGAERPVRPLTTVYTYNDISPVATAQHVHEGEATDPVATIRHPPPPSNATSTVSGSARVETSSFTANTNCGDPQARMDSVNNFWNRLNGAYNIKIKDVDRSEELGRNVVPGTPNCRLIGSRWRYIPRPVEGDVIYTDYYGRCGEDPCSYYGRRYNMETNEFKQNWLVDDLDYIKVQASMPGIHSLRTRPGLAMDATVVSGPSARLGEISPYTVKQARGVHKLNGFARVRVSAARPDWV